MTAQPEKTPPRAERPVLPVWRATVMRTILPGALTLVLFITAIFSLVLPALEQVMMDQKRDMARELTMAAWTLLDTYAQQVPEQLTLEEAQTRAIKRIRALRYGPEGKDYFWINDMTPVLIMHPYRTELEGTDVTHFTDRQGKELFSEFVRVVRQDGEGFVDYLWWWKDSDRIEPKVSFVKGFEPWGWVVGTGMYIEDVQAEMAAIRRRTTWLSAAILACLAAVVAFMVWQARGVERDRFRAQSALIESERRFRGIFDSAFQHVALLDRDGRVIEINETAQQFAGAGAAEMRGQFFWRTPLWLGVPQSQDRLRRGLGECRQGRLCRFEAELMGRNGHRITVDFSAKPVVGPGGAVTGIVAEARDITEMALLEEKLRQSQKMEAVGQLAGGVAHDFNNILLGILGHAELLLEGQDPESETADSLRRIAQASQRAGDLTRQLLSFSRKGKLQSRPVDLHAIIDEVCALLTRSIDKGITLERRLEADHPWVEGDPTMLQNALLNLGVNARDALGQLPDDRRAASRIIFTTANVQVPAGSGNPGAGEMPAGRYLALTVADTGGGIPADVQVRIFEPFFTTKGPGEGTGLGLAGVFGCVQAHGGSVTLQGSSPAGTTFALLLPECAEPAPTETRQDTGMIHGKGHVLLVDDEEVVRHFGRKALLRLGYTVETCSDGLEAVEHYRRHGVGIDLVILDLIMNRMGGEETYRHLREIDPQVKVLVSSGYSRNEIVSDLLAAGVCGFLGKPFRLEELSREVARILGHASAR